jgi:two-component system sensor histidine kinase and response regulator WspE
MTNGTSQHLGDPSMTDLFRAEVETHTATITDSLLSLENNPSASDNLDALIRAAHSIKGGARIVDLDAAAQISHAMETCFVAVQTGEVALDLEQITILRQGVDLLRRIADAISEGDAEWSVENQEEIEQCITTIKGIVTSGQPSTKSERKQESPSTIKFSRSIADESMLQLFRTEMETHTATLTDGLLALEEHPGAADQLEALMRAAHSIKGGARVVELDAAVQIAHVMEDCFVAAQKGKIALSSDHIDILFQGVDMLRQIAESAGEGVAEWLAERQEKIQQLFIAISTILSGEAVAPVSSPSTQAPTLTPSSVDPTSTIAEVTPKSSLEGSVPQAAQKSSASETLALPETKEKSLQATSEEKDRMVRVTAAKIERLLGLGGEVVVSARWLPSFSESLLVLKKTHGDVFAILEKLHEALGNTEDNPHAKDLVLQVRERTRECNLLLADRLNQLDMFTSTSANLSDRLYHEVIGVRMRPFADGVQRFPRMVRDLAKKLGKKVKFEIIGKSTEVDRDILEKLDAPLTHLLRNAIDHGLESPEERLAAGKPETGTLRLEAVHRAGMLMIMLSDDGKGINLAKLRQKILQRGLADEAIVDNLTESELMEFLFLPGFSTSSNLTEISGRGVGLDVVHDMVHEVGGIVRAFSTPGKGVSFHLELPLTLSVIRTFLVEIAGEPYAFPLARIDRCVVLSEEDLETVEDRQYFRFGNTNIALVDIHDVLEIEEPVSHPDGLPVVVISDRSHAYGLLVDKFVGECDLVVRPIDPRLGKIPDISSVAVMLDGSPVLIFDVEDMLRSIDKKLNFKRLRKVKGALAEGTEEVSAKRILVVDDSITVREMERKLLENQGYHVEIAVDGMDGWNAVRTENFDLVVSDIDMPRMNGIELVTHIKQHEELKSLPVIIISYKDTEEHRLQGLEAGANYYLTKSSFQDDSFINAVVDLIGEADQIDN